MEPHERLELIDSLLEDANQNIEALNRAISAQDRAQSSSHTEEHHVLQQEHTWWEETCQSLTSLRSTLANIEQSERQRGVRT